MKPGYAESMIERLHLQRHPEGGWYRESYRSADIINAAALPERYGGSRYICTCIYFLLERGDISALHRIKSDELWLYHAGAPLVIQIITPDGEHREMIVGADDVDGASFQAVVPAGCWFGAEVSGPGEYALVGCIVAPGFDFTDFELGRGESLLSQFPRHASVIRRFTRE